MARPAPTARLTWTRKAPAAPSHTRIGRLRLPMTSVAIIVLSGSSAAPTRTKTVAMTPGVTRDAFGSGRRRLGELRDHVRPTAHPLAEADVDRELLERLHDASLPDAQGVGGAEAGDVLGELAVAAQRPYRREHGAVRHVGEALEEHGPLRLGPLPDGRAAHPVREQGADEERTVVAPHLAQREVKGALAEAHVGERAEGEQVAPLVLRVRRVPVAVQHGGVVAVAGLVGDDR